MSHLENIPELQTKCRASGDCEAYNTYLHQQDQQYDKYTKDAVNLAITVALPLIIIGLIFVLAGKVSSARKIATWILVLSSIILPFLLIEAGAFVGGFMIAFSSCFKRNCSAGADQAWLLTTVLALFISVPLAIVMIKKRRALKAKLLNARPRTWLILGLFIILPVLYIATSFLQAEYRQNQRNKSDIRRQFTKDPQTGEYYYSY